MSRLDVGDSYSGFTVVSVKELPEQNGIGYRLRHDATGLDLYQVANDDPENLFAFVFKTPARNNFGTAHIIEHSVLAGSKKYRAKDPFLSLLKGSANTFLNAMTYPDKTVYPAASPIAKDYLNLMQVYADAVFSPLLRRHTFAQEGVRVTVSHKNTLGYDGIVFNEMKGSYDDHDAIVAERSLRSLFPDTPYGFDSGGDPADIIHLTYEEFKGFHAEFYHPSNCRVFLYGDHPLEPQLEFLEREYLKEYTAVALSSSVPTPKRWKSPQRFEFTSPIDEDESLEQKSTITLNWLACDVTDPLDVMTLELLTEALLGNPGAPLYKAIVESGLGSDIASISGMESDLKDVVFSLGIRGSDAKDEQAFTELMISELSRLVTEGLGQELVEQAIKRIEFGQKELRGGIPTGLRVFSRAIRGWLHGLCPEDTLLFDPVMSRLKQLVLSSEGQRGYLENWIDEHLVKNPHRSTVIVRPDREHERRFENHLKSELEALQKSLTKKELKGLQEKQKEFQAFCTQKDSSAILDQIPRLSISDLPQQISRLDVEKGELDGVPLYHQHMFTNSIVYTDLLFDLSGLEEELLDLLPLFSRLIYMTGLEDMSYDELSRQLSEYTGGFYTLLETALAGEKRYLVFRVKMLEEDVPKALDLLFSVLLCSRLDDQKRISTIIGEQKSDFSQHIISSGSAYAALYASSRIDPAARLEERWKGISQWKYISALDPEDPQVLGQIAEKLQRIRSRVIGKDGLLVNLCCEQRFAPTLNRELSGYLAKLPPLQRCRELETQSLQVSDAASGKVFFIPAQVGYTAKVFHSAPFGTREQSAQAILAHLLKTNHLWEAIRVLGGAYGASASVDLLEELFLFSSYRDPRLADTYADYYAALKQIADGAVDQATIELSVISLVGVDARPLSPSEKSFVGLRRVLYGITDELRTARREQLLSMSADEVVTVAAKTLEDSQRSCSMAVLCSKSLYQKDQQRLPAGFEETESLAL